ncbi:MAG: hypothetical protein EBY22_13095 [Gammaproteobacteria bacterium]|nr:hypothetical protein [Gammaproteobacteria bacterium]
MKFLSRLLLLSLFGWGSVFAQSNLPNCEGLLTNASFNCYGTFTTFLGNTYVGEFKDGKFHGQGTNNHADGKKYVGEYKNGKANGLGTLYASNGSVTKQGIWADGNFVRSAPVHQASAVNQTVATATQQPNISQSNLPACKGRDTLMWSNCFGTETYPSGTKYVGEFINGKPHGQGTFFASNGTISEGIWADGKFVRAASGQHIAVPLNTGLSTSDHLQSSLPLCQGTTVPKWTDCYGVQTWGNDDVKYVGEYKSGLHHGKGVLFLAGEKYVGDFDSGVFNGFGSFTTSTGVKYVGDFKYGKRHGLGIEYASNGVVIRSGRWTNDSFFNAFEIEASRFPFNLPPQENSASLKPLFTDEIEKLRAEADQAKRKQVEAEAQLRVAQQSVQCHVGSNLTRAQ